MAQIFACASRHFWHCHWRNVNEKDTQYMSKAMKALAPVFITSAVAGVFLSILAPLGTDQISLPLRVLFWVSLCLAGGMGAAVSNLFIKIRFEALSPWPCALIQSVGATLFVSVFLFPLNVFANGGQLPSIKTVILVLFYIWVISMAISSIGALLSRQQQPPNIPASPSIFERLAPNLRSAEIYALSGEDHYVRIVTSKGEELVLMRLSDAIKEVAPVQGLSPHRSWWVAENGIEKITKSKITLKTGLIAPISRNGLKTVRQAGWI